MTEEEREAALARWPQIKRALDAAREDSEVFYNGDKYGTAPAGWLWLIAYSDSVHLVMSTERMVHLRVGDHDRAFGSLDAAMNYCLIEGLLV